MSFLRFREAGRSESGLTRIVSVESNNIPLGQIRWFAPWRRYTFAPAAGTVFDIACLYEITSELSAMMEARKNGTAN